MLSSDSLSHLASFLPPSSFASYTPTVESAHPAMETTEANTASLAKEGISADVDMLDREPSFLKCHFLQSAVRAFQEDLCSSHLTPEHAAHMEAYETALRDNATHAPWKDEEWQLQIDEAPTTSASPTKGPSIGKRKGKAKGPAKSNPRFIELADLASSGYILPGDLIVYKRSLPVCEQSIQKDLLIQSVLPTGALVLLLAPSIEQYLPFDLLTLEPEDLSRIASTSLTPSTAPNQSKRVAALPSFDELWNADTAIKPPPRCLSITTTAPTSLETHLVPLFADANTSDFIPSKNHMDSWKSFTVWRWPEGWEHALQNGFMDGRGRGARGRGGRELVGTLFYLRSCAGDLE
ncbi:hypothetical protein BOTBODRAFT_34800 [Botryobasidium botryosum FD-172 SS1]|uniref:ASX DEUBAD domain-containing protein n=1 Tax=Botryobasidium botryosum (strain FD-172 SS1) TaxID=930990 RepID=A0A067M9E0_BOTB1|nr:hypothetical protein BOTBODRAFT_34800 [Botryobasidium botryosum FD-172 SS1]